MRALIVSDLHLTYNGRLDGYPIPDDVDAAIVAGDVSAPVAKSMAWLHEAFASQGIPVVYVAGNHEHYGHDFNESMRSGRVAQERYPDVHFLENEERIIGGVRFLGCTLWTDFALYDNPELAANAAYLGMADYSTIRDGLLGFTPERTRFMHEESREWLEERLAEGHDGPTVVVTHHCPHPLSRDPRFQDDPLTPAFVSDLSAMIERHQPDLWVHGHVHCNLDYVVPGTRTRVICNPRGYVRHSFDRGYKIENKAFDPALIVALKP